VTKLGSQGGQLRGDEQLELLSHATFLLAANGRRVLFDPWLVGPTYWGSWHLWPRNPVRVESLGITDVVITHPHPDHFHLPTLNRLPRAISIHIPNFESGILQTELRKMDFMDINLIHWEVAYELTDGLEISFLRPTSMWEDASCLVSLNGWNWLNQNDSGAALRDELLPDSIDLLTTSFDVGASGYPLTWNVGQTRSQAILRNKRSQILESIRERAQTTKARYYAPFAGWWRHGLTEHEEFANALPRSSLADLREAFSDISTTLIETIPSSKVNLKSMTHTCNEYILAEMDHSPSYTSWSPPPSQLDAPLLRQKLIAYMTDLVKLSVATQCEPVLFIVRIGEIDLEESFTFGDPLEEAMVTITADIPQWVGEKLVSEDDTATWNHFDIGYWVRWMRAPDIYPANFMRLLQLGIPAGLKARKGVLNHSSVRTRSIADFLERDAELARAILSRSGLPCSGCSKANSDSLESAFSIHGIPFALRERALSQLAALLQGER